MAYLAVCLFFFADDIFLARKIAPFFLMFRQSSSDCDAENSVAINYYFSPGPFAEPFFTRNIPPSSLN